MITDSQNVILEVNPGFTEITGYSAEDVLGRSPSLLSSGLQSSEFYAQMWQELTEFGHWEGEIWNRRKSGEVYAERLSISTINDAEGQLCYYLAIFSDISRSKAQQAELERIAHFDVLTGVPNRRLLSERMSQALARARRGNSILAVCCFDLDGFKPVNDVYGHKAGDQMLIEISQRLQRSLREVDTLARVGGDEFVLLLTELSSADECLPILERVLHSVSEPVSLDGREVSVSASIGVTLFPTDNSDPDTLLRHADMAMYRAKDAGKNRYHLFDTRQEQTVQQRRQLLSRFGKALKEEELALWYQPKVDMVSGTVLGFEALLRWNHPERGILAPGHFLPELMGSELEIPLGDWVISAAMAQMTDWLNLGLHLSVSVNVSGKQLLKAGFVERLHESFQKYPRVRPTNFELELLESSALVDIESAQAVLEACVELGLHLSLDDFGTGFSSLVHLRRLPVHSLKIDHSFVAKILESSDDLAIVESVIWMALAFNREVVAEGVEDRKIASFLVQLGCRIGQGYGIARPMPAQDVSGWLESWDGSSWADFDGQGD